jgi:probable DNA metabolism protein
MLKAVLLSELTGQQPEVGQAETETNLFAACDQLNADDYSLEQLTRQLAAKTGDDYRWIDQYPGRRLVVMVLFNLRNCSRDSERVIFAALTEAVRSGPASCICGRSRASAVFRRRSREVGNEVHRLLGLIRFQETADGDLVAKPQLAHQTADLLLRKFQLRYPNRRLLFILPQGALCCHQGQLSFLALQDLPAPVLNPTDDFANLWETYYRSQYIEARKNIRLASRFIPKKYWDWLPEGKILKQEAMK